MCFKIFLTLLLNFFFINGALANQEIYKIHVPHQIKKLLKSFEPSSILYLPDLDQYLVSSDDTDEAETPYLFLMNSVGRVEAKILKVQGLTQMTDIESMSQDNQGHIYLLSSQSINKHGANKFSRSLFSKVDRKGQSLVLNKKIELRSLLISALSSSHIPELDSLAEKFYTELDIESHFLLQGELYVGIKNPQARAQQAIVLNLGSVDYLFDRGHIQDLSVWRVLDFSSASGECLLSDLQIQGDELYASTTSDKGDKGRLWKYHISSSQMEELASFPHVKPEGLALRANENSLMIVFDQGEDTPLYQLRRTN